MRFAIFIFLIISIWSCDPTGLVIEDHQLRSLEGRMLPNGADTSPQDTVLLTEQGPFGPFGVGSFWTYVSRSISCSDVPPFTCDTSIYSWTVKNEKDTIFLGGQWLGQEGKWRRMKNKKYQFLATSKSDFEDGILLKTYLNLNIEEGQYWYDTLHLTGSPFLEGKQMLYRYKYQWLDNDKLKVTEYHSTPFNIPGQPIYGGPETIVYQMGIGVIGGGAPRFNGHYSFSLDTFHIAL